MPTLSSSDIFAEAFCLLGPYCVPVPFVGIGLVTVTRRRRTTHRPTLRKHWMHTFWRLRLTLQAAQQSYHISYHIISCQKLIMRPLLREPRPYAHYRSQPNAKIPRKTQKSTSVKSLTRIVWFPQFSGLDRISHGADVVGQSVPGGRTRMWERPLAELRAQPW